MRNRICALFVLMVASLPAVLSAQEPASNEANKPTLEQRLTPESTAKLLAPAPAVATSEKEAEQPAMLQRRAGSGVALMIAGGALFVAGLIVGDDAGTVLAVTGAAIGAYGLYQYFR